MCTGIYTNIRKHNKLPREIGARVLLHVLEIIGQNLEQQFRLLEFLDSQ